MAPDKQQLIDAMEHISFEMNRYLYTAHPIFKLPGRYPEVVRESCLLHSRVIGEFFFEKVQRPGDIRILHYLDELTSKDELVNEIERSRTKWKDYKERTDKKLAHLTFTRNNSNPMNMQEKEEINFDLLINLFEKNLPKHFREKWDSDNHFVNI